MTAAGLHVPPGFTITTEACKWFYENHHRWPEGLEDQVRAGLAALEQKMGRKLGQGQRPLLVSVRSGAAVSMPGMMDTILNCGLHPGLAEEVVAGATFWPTYAQFVRMFSSTVAGIELDAEVPTLTPTLSLSTGRGGGASAANTGRGGTEPSRESVMRMLADYRQRTGHPFPTDPWQCLVECINAVFRSWNSERAIAYRAKHDIRGLAGTAVNVQAMFPSRVSGVLFTQNPNALLADQIVIESAYGLGESVVSGDVTPDKFVVARGDLGNVQATIGNKASRVSALGDDGSYDARAASLTDQQIGELCRIALGVERHFGKPMDIEWGLADGRFAVLQCRPIRGLEIAADVEVGRQEEITRLRSLAGDKRLVWVAHNLGETLRFPTPLTWDIVDQFMSGSGGFGRLYRDLGYRPSGDLKDRGFLELICGRIYADPKRVAKLFWEHWPVGYNLDEVARDRRALDRAPTDLDMDRVDAWFLVRMPRTLWAMMRGRRKANKARAGAKERFEKQILPPFLKYVQERRAMKLESMSTAQVLAELADRRKRVLDEFGNESLKPGFFGSAALDTAENLLVQIMGKAQGTRLASELVTGLEGDITFEQDSMLYDVAHGRASMPDFLARFGHRSTGEMELSEPRWREDSGYLERIVEQLRATNGPSPRDRHHANVARREEAQKQLPDLLHTWGAASLREDLEANLAEARELLPYRETGKHYLMMGYELLRTAILELGRRWDLGSGVFYLEEEELARFEEERSRLIEQIEKRKIRWQSFQRLDLADIVDSQKLDRLGIPEEVAASEELSGDAVAAGVATGVARIVLDPKNTGDLGRDYILVCPSTDPGWTPLFINARGLIVERGGMLSHGAIVARDFGIPAVVCPRATSLIRGGAAIRIDGNSGKITVLKVDDV
jgi:pyruvate,water dikinase